MTRQAKFRNDIQGLRALAVLTVLLFHIDVSLFDGGFLGVDIFFVISGYLITGNIIRKYEAGIFTFTDFFIRRFKRLVPASVVTIALTLLFGYFFLAPSEWQESGRTGFHALLFSSNFIFWSDAGYFDAAAVTKPFLHFWSLSVEEQFYFIWPITLIFFLSKFGKKGLFIAISALSVFSLVLAELLLSNHPSSVFFLMPFRVFEFGAGAILAVKQWEFPEGKVKSICVPLGLSLMLGSIFLMDKSDHMPGFLSLFPVIGCCLVLASPNAKFSSILSNKVAGRIGNASYSIYLVHWPIVVFYKMSESLHLSPLVQFVMFFTSIGLGFALYYSIETPLRQNRFWNTSYLLGLPQLLAISTILVTLYGSASLWSNRMKNTIQGPDNNQTITSRVSLRQATLDMREANLPNKNTGKAKIHIIGDSQGKGMAITMKQLGFKLVSHDWLSHWCQPVIGERPKEIMFAGGKKATEKQRQDCVSHGQNSYMHDNIQSAEVVLIAAKWQDWSIDMLPPSLELLKTQTEAPIIVVGMGAEFTVPVPRFFELLKSENEANKEIVDKTHPEWKHNRKIKKISEKHGASFLNRRQLQCLDGTCPIYLSHTRELLLYDNHHITVAGAKNLAENIKKCKDKPCKILKRLARSDR